MNDIISIGEFSKSIGKSTQTLRRWDDNGTLKCHHQSPSGKRYYKKSQIQEYLNDKTSNERIVIGYCRVSTSKQKDDLERQIENMKSYLISQGNSFKIISDIGSGINYNKKGLNEILEMINNHKVSKIVVLYKDRLIRFGFELLETICKLNDVKIEIIDTTERTEQEELVEDLVQIITVFSCKLQGKRSKKTKNMIKELTTDE